MTGEFDAPASPGLPFPPLDGEVELSTICPDFLRSNMRALPLQSRARLTVERILVAGRGVGLRHGFEGLTLDAVAASANVRLGAVYRYFSSPDDLVRTIVRLWVAARFERFRSGLAKMQFGTTSEVVDYLSAGVERMLITIDAENRISRRLKLRLMRDFHEIPHGELSAMAGDVCAAMARGGVHIEPMLQPRLAMAFSAGSAFTKTALMNSPQMLATAYFHDQLRRLFRDALAAEPLAALPASSAAPIAHASFREEIED